MAVLPEWAYCFSAKKFDKFYFLGGDDGAEFFVDEFEEEDAT